MLVIITKKINISTIYFILKSKTFQKVLFTLIPVNKDLKYDFDMNSDIVFKSCILVSLLNPIQDVFVGGQKAPTLL